MVDVFPIIVEFASSVWEYDERGVDLLSPSDDPLSMGLDELRGLGAPDDDFELANTFGTSFVVIDGIHAGKDVVEVDCPSVE